MSFGLGSLISFFSPLDFFGPLLPVFPGPPVAPGIPFGHVPPFSSLGGAGPVISAYPDFPGGPMGR